ncbi:MAG: hypothetical protein B6D58_06905 [candidate division Zixibacteria bacterium 4484_95]|nr:MAG: hypothetical protein B6D58_06905 [candidate division Zixibacteria bacterium 4484_95]
MKYKKQDKLVLMILILLTPVAFCLEGPDFMLIGDYYIPTGNGFCITAKSYDKAGLSTVFRSASLYGVGSLKWINSGVKLYSQFGSVGVVFRDYGINDLYSSTAFKIFLQKSLLWKISLGASYSHNAYIYGDDTYRSSHDEISFTAGWSLHDLNIAILIDNKSLNNKNGYSDELEFIISGCWSANEILSFYGVYFKDKLDKNRFLIGQKLELIKPLIIEAGFLSGPEIYFVGLEVVYKRLVFGYTFFDVGALPDCSRLTLSYR